MPALSADEKKKLRDFTDTGGTILVEASCGNPAVREWFKKLAAEVWPEWPLKPLGPDHPSFLDPHPLKTQRPEILGIDDGLRTCVFYAMDDVSCAWQTKAMAGREYVFQWGVDLFTYATDHGALRARLAGPPPKSDRYAAAVKGGAKAALSVARPQDRRRLGRRPQLQGPGEGRRGRRQADRPDHQGRRRRHGSDGPGGPGCGLPGGLEGSGTGRAAQRQALKAYLAKGGFLWAEAAGGAGAFDQSFRKLAADLGWELKDIDKTAPLVTGQFQAAAGYDLSKDVRFRHALKLARAGRASADLVGIYQDGKLVGVYSPLDVVFSSTPYEAGGCRGYEPEDAAAVAANIFLFLSDR